MKLVLDTNVIISAILFGGNPERILLEIAHKNHTLLISPFVLNEVGTILSKKAHWMPYQIEETLRGLHKLSTLINPKTVIRKITKDASDNRILELAVDGDADYIISGDKKHLLPLKIFRGTPILSPTDFLKEVLYN